MAERLKGSPQMLAIFKTWVNLSLGQGEKLGVRKIASEGKSSLRPAAFIAKMIDHSRKETQN